MRKSILGLIACVILSASYSHKDVAENKPGGNEKVTDHRNDSIATNDAATDNSGDGISFIGVYDPRTVWFLQNLHVAMDNAGEAAAVKVSVYKHIKEEKES